MRSQAGAKHSKAGPRRHFARQNQGLGAIKQGLGVSKQGLGARKQGLGTTKQGLGAAKQSLRAAMPGLKPILSQKASQMRRAKVCLDRTGASGSPSGRLMLLDAAKHGPGQQSKARASFYNTV